MITRIVKAISKKTYVGKDKKEHHFRNYRIEALLENGKKIIIPFEPKYDLDKDVFKKLDLVAELKRDE